MVYAKYLMDEYDKREYSMNEILEWNQHVFNEAFSYEEKKRKLRFLKVLAGIPVKERSRSFGLRELVSLFDNEILIPPQCKPSQFYTGVTYGKMVRLMKKVTGIKDEAEIERIMDTLPYPSREFVKMANALPDFEVEDKVSVCPGVIDSFPAAEEIMGKQMGGSMFILDLPQIEEAEKKGCVSGFVSLTEEDFATMKKVFALRSPFVVEKMHTRKHFIAFVESFRFVRRRNIQNNAARYVCFVEIRVMEKYLGRGHAFEGFFKLHEKDDYLS